MISKLDKSNNIMKIKNSRELSPRHDTPLERSLNNDRSRSNKMINHNNESSDNKN